MILNKHKGEFMCRKLSALNIAVGGAEHAQRTLLSGVKASFYDAKQTQGRVHVPRIRGS